MMNKNRMKYFLKRIKNKKNKNQKIKSQLQKDQM